MHTLQCLATCHGVEQPINDQWLQMLIDQMIDQARTAVAVSAALSQVLDQRLAVAELQLATREPLAKPRQLERDQFV